MSGKLAGRSARDRVYFGVADRWIARAALVVMVVGLARDFAEPSLAGLAFDLGSAAFFAVMAWLFFRHGFRTRLVARSDHFEVVNLLTVDRVAYRDVAQVRLDLLSVRITLGSGKRIRVWGLGDSLLDTGGPKGENLVDRLGKIVEERQTDDGPEHTRTHLQDWWVLLVLLALFGGAIVYRVLTQ